MKWSNDFILKVLKNSHIIIILQGFDTKFKNFPMKGFIFPNNVGHMSTEYNVCDSFLFACLFFCLFVFYSYFVHFILYPAV